MRYGLHKSLRLFCVYFCFDKFFEKRNNQILQSLQPYMEKPEVVRYGDGHYRRTIYGLGPYIADYPEQVLLACIVQGWCPRYDWHLIIHMMLTLVGLFRCDTHWKDLDHGDAGRRAHRHTEALLRQWGKSLFGMTMELFPICHVPYFLGPSPSFSGLPVTFPPVPDPFPCVF